MTNKLFFGSMLGSQPRKHTEDDYAIFAHNNATMSIFILNEKEIIHCNPATLRLFGAGAPSDIIGQHPGKLSPEVQPNGRLSSARLAR